MAVLAAEKPGRFHFSTAKDLTGWKTVGAGPNLWTYGKAALNPDNAALLKVDGPGEELISTNRTVNLSSNKASVIAWWR